MGRKRLVNNYYGFDDFSLCGEDEGLPFSRGEGGVVISDLILDSSRDIRFRAEASDILSCSAIVE